MKIYEVGGCVRDELLGNRPKDRDYVIVGANKEDIKTLRNKGYEPVGASFEVYIHPETGDEYALARRETSTGNSTNEFNTINDGVDLKEDLMRRDLTINAIARDVETGEIIDPFDGREDIQNETLRHIAEKYDDIPEKFTEDPLRILRLARFAARFPNFSIAEKTKELSRSISNKLTALSKERIGEEFKKAMRQAQKPQRFYDILNEVNALKKIAPEIYKLQQVPAGPKEKYGSLSAYEHTMLTISTTHQIKPNDIKLLFAALAHDLGKAVTREESHPGHPEHNKNGVMQADLLSSRLALSNDLTHTMKQSARIHKKALRINALSAKELLNLAKKLYKRPKKGLNYERFCILARSNNLSRPNGFDFSKKYFKRLEKAFKAIDKIDGEYIVNKYGLDEGPEVGQKIQNERIAVIKNNNDTKENTTSTIKIQ